jgi:hypothetical protein
LTGDGFSLACARTLIAIPFTSGVAEMNATLSG